MKRIGLTQRVDVSNHGERRDCLDQQWAKLLFQHLNFLPIPFPNFSTTTTVKQIRDYLDDLYLDGIIFTGGNDLAFLPEATSYAPERDRVEGEVLVYCIDHLIPVIGVCRGMQLICSKFGGKILHRDGHVGKRHPVTTDFQGFGGLSDFQVNSFHNYVVVELTPPLKSIAIAPDGSVEGCIHTELPILGLMWHPEREVPFSPRDTTLIQAIFGGGRI